LKSPQNPPLEYLGEPMAGDIGIISSGETRREIEDLTGVRDLAPAGDF